MIEYPLPLIGFIAFSGTGKTTLLNLVAGILVPQQGRVDCAGVKVSVLGDRERRDFRISTIGFVFQDFELLDYLDVLDNILHPYRITGALRLDRTVRARARQLADGGDPATYAQAVNGLLKAVALRAFPRRQVAAASGEQWLAFLRDTAGANWQLPDALVDAPYRPEPELQPEELHRAAASWIRQHKVPS